MAVTLEELGDIAIELGDAVLPTHHPVVHYDAISDEFIFWLTGEPVPHLTEPANDVASILFDLENGEALGVQIDNFATYAVPRYPNLEPVARFFSILPRPATSLFSPQTVMEVQEIEESEYPLVKHVLMTIIDQTGGFVEGAILDRTER